MKFQNISIHGSKVMLCTRKRDEPTNKWTNQSYFIKREIALKWEIIQISKKIQVTYFFHEESIYETLAYMVLKLCYAKERVTNERTSKFHREFMSPALFLFEDHWSCIIYLSIEAGKKLKLKMWKK